MKILSMTATFGKLAGARLELTDGLNLIAAPNEGGKSTWCAFIKAMFYGIDTRDRDKKGHLAEKNKYQPWSGAPMEGEMDLEWQGRRITIRRGPRGSTPFGAFSAVYTGTEEPVPGLTGETCGQMLLGVGREVFVRSAFIGQEGALTVTSAPELESRIAALVSSGEEDVSSSQAQRQLKEWLNWRKVNKSVGRIPQLEEELAQIRQSRRELEEVNAALRDLEGRQARAVEDRRTWQRQMDLHTAAAQGELDRSFAQAAQELRQAQDQLDSLRREQSRFGALPSREELKRAQGELAFLKALDPEIRQGQEELEQAQQALEAARAQARDDRFPGMSGEEGETKAQKAVAAWQACMDREKKGGRNFLLLQGAGIVALAALVALAPWWWLGLVGYALFALLSLLARSAGKKAGQEGAKILERYGVESPEELLQAGRAYRERMAAADQCAQQVRMIQSGLKDRQARRENSRQDLFDFVHSFAPEVKELFGCSAALSRALNLEERENLAVTRLKGARRLYEALKAQGGREEGAAPLPAPERPLEETAQALAQAQVEEERLSRALHQVQGRLQAMGDPAQLSARQEELEEELTRRQEEYQAISLALETLKEADGQLQQRFAPQLSRRAGELLSRLTGGRYQSLTLSRELEAAARTQGDVLPRSALYLSKGTVDQVYLAVRLAVYDLCMKGAPLVLDDALAAFDDARMAQALDLLLERGEEEQILFFTGHSREKTWLEGRREKQAGNRCVLL